MDQNRDRMRRLASQATQTLAPRSQCPIFSLFRLEVERSRREEFVPPDPKFGGVLVRIPQPVPLIYPALSLSFPSESCSVIIIHRVSQVLSNYIVTTEGGVNKGLYVAA